MSQEHTPISTLLAAMNAVDSVRNEEQILNDEVNIEERKAALAAKLKKTYADQNVVVSDEEIARGVNEYFEQRYAFKGLAKNLTYYLASLYIIRAKIFRVCSFACLFLLGILVAYLGAKQAAKGYDTYKIASAKAAASKKVLDAKIASEKADRDAKAKAAAEANRAKALADELASIPGQIKTQGAACLNILEQKSLKPRIESLVAAGVGAAAASDLNAARNSLQELQSLFAQLNQEYELRINVNGKTGFWRALDRNPNVKNYYVIVNAVHNNRPVGVSIKNEETAHVATLSTWAERVSQYDFERIRDEKTKTGLIKNTLFGVKTKGYLHPNYKQGEKAERFNTTPDIDPATYRLTKW